MKDIDLPHRSPCHSLLNYSVPSASCHRLRPPSPPAPNLRTFKSKCHCISTRHLPRCLVHLGAASLPFPRRPRPPPFVRSASTRLPRRCPPRPPARIVAHDAALPPRPSASFVPTTNGQKCLLLQKGLPFVKGLSSRRRTLPASPDLFASSPPPPCPHVLSPTATRPASCPTTNGNGQQSSASFVRLIRSRRRHHPPRPHVSSPPAALPGLPLLLLSPPAHLAAPNSPTDLNAFYKSKKGSPFVIKELNPFARLGFLGSRCY